MDSEPGLKTAVPTCQPRGTGTEGKSRQNQRQLPLISPNAIRHCSESLNPLKHTTKRNNCSPILQIR